MLTTQCHTQESHLHAASHCMLGPFYKDCTTGLHLVNALLQRTVCLICSVVKHSHTASSLLLSHDHHMHHVLLVAMQHD